jgi:hypothetical protein
VHDRIRPRYLFFFFPFLPFFIGMMENPYANIVLESVPDGSATRWTRSSGGRSVARRIAHYVERLTEALQRVGRSRSRAKKRLSARMRD